MSHDNCSKATPVDLSFTSSNASTQAQHICLWLTRDRLQTEELNCLHARPFDPSDHKFSTQWLSESPQQRSPSTWRPFSQNQLLPYFRRSMTCAFCSSFKIRAQETSNHWSQQLPEVPPTNSDDIITSAPRPPSSLTTEFEPRNQMPGPLQLLTATANSMRPLQLLTATANCMPPNSMTTVPPTIMTTPARLHLH